MTKHSPAEVKVKKEMAKKILSHHFAHPPKNIEFKPAGKTHYVFEARTKEGDIIVRIGDSNNRLRNFLKEQWVSREAAARGIPVAEILEVGHELIEFPYMLTRKLDGKEATDHPDRLEILKMLGKITRSIHTIPTNGFGNEFDWSNNKLSKNITWKDMLENELLITERLKYLGSQKVLDKNKMDNLVKLFDKIRLWKKNPVLNHGDLRLKNVIVNEEGKILAIIDWDNAFSSIGPYWDFSIALHDLSIDGKEKFLEGYGLDFKEFNKMAYSLTAFNLINYVPVLQDIIAKKDKGLLNLYKLRLNGSLDLFSL